MRIFLTCLLITFLFGLTISVQAQLLNVESVRANADSAGWHGELEFDLSINQYNDRVIEFTNESNISYLSKEHAYLMLNNLKLVNLDGASLISSGYSHLRTTFFRNNRFSPELFVQYQYNNNLGLENRALGGIGFKYIFHKTDSWISSFSSGIMAEYEEWKPSGQQVITNKLIKSTSNISLRGKLNERATFLLVGYYQARPDKYLKARSILESKFQMEVTKSIALSISFIASYDTNPVIDIPQWTYELSNGLVIKF